ncbi:neprilysin-4-like [Drosophila takahashii]|uniref:neprilysin-4-like n=1 Tax=Drosophila takahashii TaxID=29030 RepID=UPI003898E9B6
MIIFFWVYYKIVWNQTRVPESCDSYFVELDKVCARYPEAVANYLAMKLLYTFDGKLNSTEQQRDYCERAVRTSTVSLLNKLYLTEHSFEEAKLEVLKTGEEVWKTLRCSPREADCLESGKLNENQLHKSPLDFSWVSWLDCLIPEIDRLEIVRDSYAATNINMHRLVVEIRRYNTRHTDELSELSKLPETMLADIQRTVTHLQPPNYHSTWPLSLKFGAFGSVLAVHFLREYKFDDEYDEGRRCFEDYHNKGLSLNGKMKKYTPYIVGFDTLRLSFSAYQRHIAILLKDSKRDKINETIPGLHLSPNQLFFLGATQLRCSDSIHDKNEALASLMSNEDFYQAFNCPVGSRMRPTANICKLW